VTDELVASLSGVLCVVFTAFTQNVIHDTGNNLTHLLHQANSSIWQQILTIHPNNNRGTETQQSTSDFDANGNLLTLDNIGDLDWHYNNTLNQLTKTDKSNTTEYYVYNYRIGAYPSCQPRG
jgi:hypothetical protein